MPLPLPHNETLLLSPSQEEAVTFPIRTEHISTLDTGPEIYNEIFPGLPRFPERLHTGHERFRLHSY
jgi:hypothetical protein